MSIRRLRYWWRTNPETTVPILAALLAILGGIAVTFALHN